jgi:hypothetical protein
VTELVKVEIAVPSPPLLGTTAGVGTARLVAIDSLAVRNARTVFVAPGSHVYRFAINYVSRTFCSGPLSGRPAHADFVQPVGQDASRTAWLRGEYEISATAEAGALVTIARLPEPDCKSDIEDYFAVAIARQSQPR